MFWNHRSHPFLDPCAPVQRIVYAANWGWFLTSFWRKTWIYCPHSLRSSKLLRSASLVPHIVGCRWAIPFFVSNVDHCGPISIVIWLKTTGWWFQTCLISISYIWDVILPIDETSIFQDGHMAPPTRHSANGRRETKLSRACFCPFFRPESRCLATEAGEWLQETGERISCHHMS